MNSLFKSLLSYAREHEDNLALVVTWRNTAIASIAAGNGSQLMSGSGNGVSFSVDSASLKVSEWFDLLQQVIDAVNRGTNASVTQARF